MNVPVGITTMEKSNHPTPPCARIRLDFACDDCLDRKISGCSGNGIGARRQCTRASAGDSCTTYGIRGDCALIRSLVIPRLSFPPALRANEDTRASTLPSLHAYATRTRLIDTLSRARAPTLVRARSTSPALPRSRARDHNKSSFRLGFSPNPPAERDNFGSAARQLRRTTEIVAQGAIDYILTWLAEEDFEIAPGCKSLLLSPFPHIRSYPVYAKWDRKQARALAAAAAAAFYGGPDKE
ncbi:uncharacterized protein BXZ73DRAFT_110812 [Epithele typhae]|uniref:uncharacterized protein n=1 Tax=Epithele typhae TaxID=378194 RepID=UPI0020085030|nr:uncharacterized protein BXZ73DRAFT_110812 [Epithele typhae]KAH9905555.1 hypothetical protein BXZ73DRAFT_110812 [Epithele typhae]